MLIPQTASGQTGGWQGRCPVSLAELRRVLPSHRPWAMETGGACWTWPSVLRAFGRWGMSMPG